MDFNRRVVIVTNMIPEGKVATYGQIAELCGMPAYSRHVGHALARGISDKAHRVINSQGILSGADSFETPDTQQNRLQQEGVIFRSRRRVDLRKYQWQPDWDELAYIEDALASEDFD